MSDFSSLTNDIKEAAHLLRKDPKDFSRLIRSNLENFKSNNLYHRKGFVPIKTIEGQKAAEKTIKKLRKTEALPEFSESAGLQNAALHIAYLLSQGVTWEEVSPTRVINDYGFWHGSVVLLVDEGNVTGVEVIQSLLIDDGQEEKTNRAALLNPYFKIIGIGCVPKKGSVTLTVILLASDFANKPDMNEVLVSDEKLEKHPELDDWHEEALKVDCEITQESSSDRVVTRVRKTWHLADNSTAFTEQVLSS
jgi:hypothetical protein